MDLFDYMREKTQEQESPLASRMRPQTLEEVVGQQHIIGKPSERFLREKKAFRVLENLHLTVDFPRLAPFFPKRFDLLCLCRLILTICNPEHFVPFLCRSALRSILSARLQHYTFCVP